MDASIISMRPEVITRDQAIARLRQRLAMLAGPDKSICQFASEEGILCRGFSRYTDEQLRQRYAFLADDRGSRADLERRAGEWQIARQQIERAATACDVQQRFVETCRGWNEFTNSELAQYCRDILGDRVVVVGHRTLVPA